MVRRRISGAVEKNTKKGNKMNREKKKLEKTP